MKTRRVLGWVITNVFYADYLRGVENYNDRNKMTRALKFELRFPSLFDKIEAGKEFVKKFDAINDAALTAVVMKPTKSNMKRHLAILSRTSERAVNSPLSILRSELRLNQSQAAKAIDVPIGYISTYEHGYHTPKLSAQKIEEWVENHPLIRRPANEQMAQKSAELKVDEQPQTYTANDMGM